MSGVHKYPTISFRISPRERDEIEANPRSKLKGNIRVCISTTIST